MPRPATLLGGLVCCVAIQAHAGVIGPDLARALHEAPAGEVVSTLVYLADRPDLDSMTQALDARKAGRRTRHEFVVRALQQHGAAGRRDLTDHLEALRSAGRVERFDAFWLGNIVRVDATAPEIERIAHRPDVARVYLNYRIESIRPVAVRPDQGRVAGSVEPGVTIVRAPEVWAMGITGEDVLVATLDTGVDGSHPALADRWRGLDPAYAGHPEWAWFDPVTGTTFPVDSDGHGTHTMGTLCGGLPGDQIGVAPGAEWINAAVIDRVDIPTTIADALTAFEWIVDPDGNPGTEFDVPDVCSNSWGLTDAHQIDPCDPLFWSPIDACEAAGIVMLFVAGNEGVDGVRRPADRATDDYRNLAVGAVDTTVPQWPVAYFSSRGPSYCTPGGEAAIKPEIAAPGVTVRSSIPGGGYANSDGTSMACPHVAGTMALMRQAAPDLTVNEIKQIIYDTAVDLGTPGQDNDFGWGMVDAFAAVQQVLTTYSLSFTFPDGRPDAIEPAGGTTVRVTVSGTTITPVPGTGTFYYSTGGPFTAVPMIETAPDEYEAVFPPFECLADVAYYFSAEADNGETVFHPITAPATTFSAPAYSDLIFALHDDFESDLGWTVSVDGGATFDGAWDRGVPVGGGDRGDPPADADGSGQCYLTDNVDGNSDVDAGTTTLTSPIIDASAPDSMLAYYRWYSNNTGANPDDVFVVEVSDDDGATWVNLETVGPDGPEAGGGWFHKEFLIADIAGIDNTNQFRIRFDASDLGFGTIVEAAVDGVDVFSFHCAGNPCPGDIDDSGDVGVTDFLAILAAWGPNPGNPADLNFDGSVGVPDFLAMIAHWGPCPP
jgi:subtilisin family serine protease